jgi:hypothetical protein
VDDVLEGRVDKGKGSIVSQILGVWLRAVETELKVRDQQELTERLENLETLLAEKKEQNRWGA